MKIIEGDILLVTRIDKNAVRGKIINHAVIIYELLWHRDFKDFFVAVSPALAKGGTIKVLMPDCTLRDINIMLSFIWEERKKRVIDKK